MRINPDGLASSSEMLSDYEKIEWHRLQQRKAAALNEKARRLLPSAAWDRVSAAVEAAKQLPGADTAADAYTATLSELGNIIGGAASHTLSSASVVTRFQAAGYEVYTLDDLQALDLKDIDSVANWSRVRYVHSSTAALGGVASAAAITGAEVLLAKGTVAGQGAKKAPKLGVVATALVADVGSSLWLATRTVASTAQYYGYDPRQPEEQLFIMSALGLGMAVGTQAKAAAYADLSQLTQLLFRNATWEKLNEKVLTKVAQQFATKFSLNLTKKELGKIVPIAGMAIGGVLNFALINRIAPAANDAYRERFLIERSGGKLSATIDQPEAPTRGDDNIISVIEMLEDEDALPSLDSGDTSTAEDEH